MNIFIDYKHHSPSSINGFLEYRTKWFLGKFKGIRYPDNAAMARGRAVEYGVTLFYKEKITADEAAKEARLQFIKETVGFQENNMLDTIIPATKKAIDYLSSKFDGQEPTFQNKIEYRIDELKLPIIGYTDFHYKNENVVDLKVVSQTPSKLSQSHGIAAAIYKMATGLNVKYLYIVPLKTEIKAVAINLMPEQEEYARKLIIHAGLSIEKIINAAVPYDILEAAFFPNPSSFFNDADLKITMENYGM